MIEDKSIGEYTQGVLEFDSGLQNIQLHLLKRSNEIDEVEATLFSSFLVLGLVRPASAASKAVSWFTLFGVSKIMEGSKEAFFEVVA